MSTHTAQQYDFVIAGCQTIFEQKVQDYGTSWRIMRIPSLTDQLFIKAQRIRTLETSEVQMVEEGTYEEFQAIVNYCVIGMIQLELGFADSEDINAATAGELYRKHVARTKDLMLAKNHDYGEAWRGMRQSSYTDMILTKLNRVKQIEDNGGKTLISEGIESHYQDIMNYAIFALIKQNEAKNKAS